MLAKTRRFIRIVYYTFVMFFGTHAIVLVLSPIWIVSTLFFQRMTPRLKVCFGRLLFTILRKQISVSGRENIKRRNRYLIVANYPSGYAGFVLMMLFPKASIVAHSYMSRVPIISTMLARYGLIYAHKQGFRRIKHFTRLINIVSQSSSIIILPEGMRGMIFIKSTPASFRRIASFSMCRSFTPGMSTVFTFTERSAATAFLIRSLYCILFHCVFSSNFHFFTHTNY